MSAGLRSFASIFEDAARLKGGEAALEALLPTPKPIAEIAATPDDRWLAAMTKKIFQAGFSWDLIEQKWPRFETVFHGFDVGRLRMLSDEDLENFLKEEGIVRNLGKIRSIRDNAIFLHEFAAEDPAYATAAQRIAQWPPDDYASLLLLLKQRASRLGLATAGYVLRSMGVDGYVLSPAVADALIREGVVSKAPTSRRDLERVQSAFNTWKEQSGRPLMQISRVLAATSP